MGIKDLARVIFKGYVHRKVDLDATLKKYGSRVAVDFSSWMHMALYAACIKLVEGDYRRAVDLLTRWFYARLDTFRDHGCTHIHFVLDGAAPPTKKAEGESRAEKRKLAKTHAVEHLAQVAAGNHGGPDVRREMRKVCAPAVQRREWWQMAAICKALDAYNVRSDMSVTWEVAPAEADGQLAHLFALRRFDLVVAEDQDLLRLGVTVLLMKLGYSTWKYRYNQCDVVDLRDLSRQESTIEGGRAKGCSLAQVWMASVLVGCDYWRGLYGVAWSKALDLIRTHGSSHAAVRQHAQDSRLDAAQLKHALEMCTAVQRSFDHCIVRTPVQENEGSIHDTDRVLVTDCLLLRRQRVQTYWRWWAGYHRLPLCTLSPQDKLTRIHPMRTTIRRSCSHLRITVRHM